MAAKQEIIEHMPREVAPQQNNTLTPMEMLGNAIERGADPALLEKLMALSERWEANQARKAFDAAMAEAKAKMGTVHRATKGNYGQYADFASVARTVDPILSENGLRYRFNITQDDKMRVTCIVSHRDGHSEETTLVSPVDTSGSKNAVQQIGSTLEYLRRYTLLAALGVATSKDDDGHAAAANNGEATEKQLEEIRALIVETKTDITEFLKVVKLESLEDFSASGAERAIGLLKKKKAAQASQKEKH